MSPKPVFNRPAVQASRASRSLGAAGEEAAAVLLSRLGWRILERNWRPSGAAHGFELDIIASDKEVLVFVEVKSRKRKEGQSLAPGGPRQLETPVYASFTLGKQRRLVHAAQHYLTAAALWDRPCRFDLLCMERFPDGHFEPEHFFNVIELGHSLDSGNAPWQPW